MSYQDAAIILIITALILYTGSVIYVRKPYNYSISTTLLLLGLISDVSGTLLMFKIAGGLIISWHTLLGLMALGGMFSLLVIGIVMFKTASIKLGCKYRDYLPLAYFIWLLSFISGIISH